MFWNAPAQNLWNYLHYMENVGLKTGFFVSHPSNGENKLPVHLELGANLWVISYHIPLLSNKIWCVRDGFIAMDEISSKASLEFRQKRVLKRTLPRKAGYISKQCLYVYICLHTCTHIHVSHLSLLFLSVISVWILNKLWTNGLMGKTFLCNCNEMLPFSCMQGGLIRQLFFTSVPFICLLFR